MVSRSLTLGERFTKLDSEDYRLCLNNYVGVADRGLNLIEEVASVVPLK